MHEPSQWFASISLTIIILFAISYINTLPCLILTFMNTIRIEEGVFLITKPLLYFSYQLVAFNIDRNENVLLIHVHYFAFYALADNSISHNTPIIPFFLCIHYPLENCACCSSSYIIIHSANTNQIQPEWWWLLHPSYYPLKLDH